VNALFVLGLIAFALALSGEPGLVDLTGALRAPRTHGRHRSRDRRGHGHRVQLAAVRWR
jgi:hypothetical protein